MTEKSYVLPTEQVDLPSTGIVYPVDSPLRSGYIELKIPTAAQEDILTNSNYIDRGIVIDKLLESLIASPGVSYEDLIPGDRNVLMLATRIFMYGPQYKINHKKENVILNLSEFSNKPLVKDMFKEGSREFKTGKLPTSGEIVTLKLLNMKDEKLMQGEIDAMKKLGSSQEVTIRLKHIIVAVGDNREVSEIRKFVDRIHPLDSKYIRAFNNKYSPDVDMRSTFTLSTGEVVEDLELPITAEFFWPDTDV